MSQLDEEAANLADRARAVAAQLKRRARKLRDRHHDYVATFKPGGAFTLETKAVLADLATIARDDQSTWHPDAREHARNEGRREIILYLLGRLRLDVQALSNIKAELKEIEHE